MTGPITFHPVHHHEKPVFSILIPSWNNLAYLRCCVESIRKNSAYHHQIILHINEGNDGSLEWVQAQHLDYTHSKQNEGVCHGFNAPATLAISEYIVLSDDDFYFAPGWDKCLQEEITKAGQSKFSISGTMIEHTRSRNICAIAPYDFGKTVQNFDEQKFLDEFEKIPFHDWSGSNWYPLVLPRSVWNTIGGLSTEFSPGMGSDPDMMIKLWKSGVRYYKGVSRARVYHFGSRTTARIVRNDGNWQFLMKWGMSISTFYKYYLKMGENFEGASKEPEATFGFRLRLLRDRFKRLIRLS